MRQAASDPGYMRPPGFTAFAKATSSMSESLIESIPPIATSVERRINTVPPAAAATGDPGSLTLAKGYNIWKK